MKLVAVEGYVKTLETIVGVTPTAVVVDTGIPSTKVKAVSKGWLLDGYELEVSGITDAGAGATIPDPNTYSVSFSATATKNKAEGKFPLTVDDITGTIEATPQIPGNPPVDYPVSVYYKISNAGQDKVLVQ